MGGGFFDLIEGGIREGVEGKVGGGVDAGFVDHDADVGATGDHGGGGVFAFEFAGFADCGGFEENFFGRGFE